MTARPVTPAEAARIVIVGGGLSGTSAAIQLVRRSSRPLSITIVEPRDRIGPGLAYSATDPDHRLNASTRTHAVDPTDPEHFTRWCDERGVFERDAAARLPSGAAFVRRRDYGDYLGETLREHAAGNASGSTIGHVRERANGVAGSRGAVVVRTESGRSIDAPLLIVATGNPAPRLPGFLGSARDHHGLIVDPLREDGVHRLDPGARVLIVGSGLTALDVVSTLVRRAHRGAIVVVSRHGLRPRGHALEAQMAAQPPGGETERPLDRLLAPVTGVWSGADGAPPSARAWLHRLRRRIRAAEAGGEAWQAAFDELRDCVWQIWPTLPPEEKRRFLRTLRPWYDVHRFRAPPQNDALVRAAESARRVAFRAGRVRAVEHTEDRRRLAVQIAAPGSELTRTECFDAVINCTGLEGSAGGATNPFLAALVAHGWLQPDATGLGFAVDAQCRAIDAAGQARPDLRVIGPPSAGTFGDPLGVFFIAAQIHRIVPDVLATLADVLAG